MSAEHYILRVITVGLVCREHRSRIKAKRAAMRHRHRRREELRRQRMDRAFRSAEFMTEFHAIVSTMRPNAGWGFI